MSSSSGRVLFSMVLESDVRLSSGSETQLHGKAKSGGRNGPQLGQTSRLAQSVFGGN